jgi:hypothetical protein
MKHARTATLLAAVGTLGLLEVIDRAGGAGAGDAGGAPSARQAYAAQAASLAGAEAITARVEEWREAARRARGAWERAKERIIVAPSPSVAQTRLAEIVQREMAGAGATLRVSDSLAPRQPVEGEALRVVGLTLDFEVASPDSLYALLDALENLEDVRTNVERLEIAGPARGGGSGLTVKMDLLALAWIES